MSAATLRTTKPGFSLIELLIVILIMATVIAIIVPALGRARTAARKVSTKALISQVTNGVEQFAGPRRGDARVFHTEGHGEQPQRAGQQRRVHGDGERGVFTWLPRMRGMRGRGRPGR